MRYFSFHITFFIFLFLIGCSTTQKFHTTKPIADDADAFSYDFVPSFINLPVSIQLKDIESQINKLLNGLIYEDTNLDDDDLTLSVWKEGPIKIEYDKGKIRTVLPLKASGTLRYGIKKMGITFNDTRNFSLNGIVTTLSDVGLTNWHLKTKTTLTSLEWKEPPTTTVGGQKVDISFAVNSALRLFKNKIEKSIDDAIQKSMDFKPYVMDALSQISEPISLNKEYETWFRLVPIELYTSDANLKPDEVLLHMGLKCQLETILGEKPNSIFDRKKIILKPVEYIPNKITANLIIMSAYPDASKNFHGQEFGEGKKKVKVQKVDLWHKSGKMIIALTLTGSLNGIIYLSGYPQYNAVTQEIYFDRLNYALDTKNVLHKTASWMAQGYILRKIQENCRYSIASDLTNAKDQLTSYLSDYSPVQGVFINGTTSDIIFQDIKLTDKGLIAVLKVEGNATVKIEGL